VVGGLGVGTLLSVVCGFAGIDIAGINPLLSYVLPIIPALLYIYFTAPDTADGTPIGFRPGKLAYYPLYAVAILALGFVTEPLSSWLPMPDYIKEIFEKILNNSGWAFATTVVAAPILEEFILRGVIERGLLRHTTPARAILWSSFFFAVIHLNPWQAIGAFIAGLFLGWIYWKTRSLTACIFIHAVNNGTAYFIQLLNPDLPAGCTYKDFIDMHMPGYYWIVFVIFAVLLAGTLYLLDKKLPKDNFKTDYE
jgi:membrane protease YdiL (CAAX protease family)